MTFPIGRSGGLMRRLQSAASRFRRDRRGNVAMITAIAIIPLLGVLGLAMEGSSWFLTHRAAQNAADAAVVAAADLALEDQSNGGAIAVAGAVDCSQNYQKEACAVAKQYGFTDGAGGATVYTTTTSTCPSTTAPINASMGCYQVTVTRSLPLYLSRLVGYGGANGTGVQVISATAYAGAVPKQLPYCLGSIGTNTGNAGIAGNGNSISLPGCPVGSNTGFKITGSTGLQAPWCVAADGSSFKGSANGSCAQDPNLDVTEPGPLDDPYWSLHSQIPTGSNCGGNFAGSSLGTAPGPGVSYTCGSLTLTSNVNVTDTETWVIENGMLYLGPNTLSTSGSGGLTIIFTSPNLFTPALYGDGYIEGTGGLDISSPLAGSGAPMPGVALYQDPVPWGYTNSAPPPGFAYPATWNGNTGHPWSVSGVVYFPNAAMTMYGTTGKASNGYNCFDMIAYSFAINGGGGQSLFSNPLQECGLQGSAVPTYTGYRYVLIG